MKIKVNSCARCGQDHEIDFKEFSQHPIESDGEILTHWGMCTNINEPVLLRIIPDNPCADCGFINILEPCKTCGWQLPPELDPYD